MDRHFLGIEWLRLKQAAMVGSPAPEEVVKRLSEKAQDRGPIITWALDLWVRSKLSLGLDAKAEFVPDFMTS